MKVLPPLSIAGTRTKGVLFTPFVFERWLILGFCAWLANFLTGSNQGFSYTGENFWAPSTDGSGLTMPSLPDWEIGTLVVVVLGVVLVFLLLLVLLFWLGCRGWFMLLDNVMSGRAEIKRPWKEFKPHADSLFGFYTGISGVMLVGLILFAIPIYFLWPQGSAMYTWERYVPAALIFSIFMFFMVALCFVTFFMLEFGTLWMYRHGGSAWTAMWKVGQLATEHPVSFIAYALVRIVMMIVFTLGGVLLGCLTCCLGFIPYLNAVITLPFSVYRVWYTVECFAQLGEDCDLRVPLLSRPTLPSPLPPAV